ncbi:unnamed protein product [Trichobilharzia szidati]|nr:unnamed protein product [Trichobilharzia szidati]
MQSSYTWSGNQMHSNPQEPQFTYSYDSTKQQPSFNEYMGPQVQDYESSVNEFTGQYSGGSGGGYPGTPTPIQSASNAHWSGNQMHTPTQPAGYWYGSRESLNQSRYQTPTTSPDKNRKSKLRIYCKYCAIAFSDEHSYSMHLDSDRHIRNFKKSFSTPEEKRVKSRSRSDFRRNMNRNRRPNFHCDDCKRTFQRKEHYLEHITAEGHMKKSSDRNKTDSDDGEERKTPRRTDYCEVCEQTFQNGRHFYAHLRWKKHKRLCRVARLLKGQLKKKPEEVAGDPLGSFTLYMNTDCSVPYGNYGDSKEVELDAGNAFLQKFLDLKHLISQESNPVGEEFIQEQVYNTRDMEYTCNLCKGDYIGADEIENHLRSLTHQKNYKEKFELEEFTFEEEMKLSISDPVFAVWKTCQSRASKELARIIGEKGLHLCICGFRITCYDDMRKHFPIKYYDIHPRIRSWKKSLEKTVRSRADRHRIDYRDCYTILNLFALPSHVIDAKRDHALEVAKAKLLEEPPANDESAAAAKNGEEDDDDDENDDEEDEEEESKQRGQEQEKPAVDNNNNNNNNDGLPNNSGCSTTTVPAPNAECVHDNNTQPHPPSTSSS